MASHLFDLLALYLEQVLGRCHADSGEGTIRNLTIFLRRLSPGWNPYENRVLSYVNRPQMSLFEAYSRWVGCGTSCSGRCLTFSWKGRHQSGDRPPPHRCSTSPARALPVDLVASGTTCQPDSFAPPPSLRRDLLSPGTPSPSHSRPLLARMVTH